MRRGPYAVGGAHKEVFAHGVAQAAQRMAHGRLRERQHCSRPGEAAFGHDGVKHTQQVEVEAAEVERHG